MPLRTVDIEEPGLNLTPMLDVVLLLVIFFMVGTQFARPESQYDITLPTVSEARPLTPLPDEIIVNVLRDGSLHVGDDTVALADLETRLVTARRKYADQVVIIRGDADGMYQPIMSVLNVCQRAGITNVQLANRVEQGTGG